MYVTLAGFSTFYCCYTVPQLRSSFLFHISKEKNTVDKTREPETTILPQGYPCSHNFVTIRISFATCKLIHTHTDNTLQYPLIRSIFEIEYSGVWDDGSNYILPVWQYVCFVCMVLVSYLVKCFIPQKQSSVSFAISKIKEFCLTTQKIDNDRMRYRIHITLHTCIHKHIATMIFPQIVFPEKGFYCCCRCRRRLRRRHCCYC